MSLTAERCATATMGDVTKTLELKLVDPNTHKKRTLRETRKAYQQALQEAFAAGCDTQSAANDVVVGYDVSGYAKNALKKYVDLDDVITQWRDDLVQCGLDRLADRFIGPERSTGLVDKREAWRRTRGRTNGVRSTT